MGKLSSKRSLKIADIAQRKARTEAETEHGVAVGNTWEFCSENMALASRTFSFIFTFSMRMEFPGKQKCSNVQMSAVSFVE